jgi:hypothetical protein
MIVKMLTHSHMTWSLGGVSTFAFRRFQGVKMTFFHYAGSQKRNGGERRSQRWPDAGPDVVFVWPDASGQCSASARVLVFRSDTVARPVTVDRTRSVDLGAYWTSTRRWHCGVRSVRQRVRSLSRWSVAQAWPARPVRYRTSVSGHTSRVWSAQRARPVSASRCRRCAIGASGQFDQRVRSAQLRLF